MPNSDLPNRRSIRLPDFDYGNAGAYFVTVCAFDHRPILGSVHESIASPSSIGRIVLEKWLALNHRWSAISIDDYYVVMPNHVHGIIWINPTGNRADIKLGTIIARYKSDTTKAVRQHCSDPAFALWQRSYYEHVIRDEDDLRRIRTYIENNPAQWTEDEYYRARHD